MLLPSVLRCFRGAETVSRVQATLPNVNREDVEPSSLSHTTVHLQPYLYVFTDEKQR